MDPKIFQKLNDFEHQRLLNELDAAMEYHLEWLASVNRILLCGHPPGAANPATLSPQQCQLGRWYFGVEEHRLASHAAFARLGELHLESHRSAQQLLHTHAQGEGVNGDHYDQLNQLSRQLRTTLRQLQQELKGDLLVSARLLGKLFESASEGVAVISPEKHIIQVNKAFCDITGYPANEILGSTPDTLYALQQEVDFYEELWNNVRSRGFWQGEIENQRRNGEHFIESLSVYAISDETGQLRHYLAIFSDVTHERESEERLYRLVHFDPVTGLPNRMLFQDRITQEIAHARRHRVRAAILFVDLDDFRQVNDQHGRPFGDRLLGQIAHRLAGLLRTSDSIGRFGGDEFVILVEITNEEDHQIVAEKVLEAVVKPFDIDGKKVQLTASIGVSLFPRHSADASELIRHADLAMYRAKVGGKNSYRLYRAEPT